MHIAAGEQVSGSSEWESEKKRIFKVKFKFRNDVDLKWKYHAINFMYRMLRHDINKLRISKIWEIAYLEIYRMCETAAAVDINFINQKTTISDRGRPNPSPNCWQTPNFLLRFLHHILKIYAYLFILISLLHFNLVSSIFNFKVARSVSKLI